MGVGMYQNNDFGFMRAPTMKPTVSAGFNKVMPMPLNEDFACPRDVDDETVSQNTIELTDRPLVMAISTPYQSH